jgi:hypothetical protein
MQAEDISEGRFPDGSGIPFVAMSTSTPRLPNQRFGHGAPPVVTIGYDADANALTIAWTSTAGSRYQVQSTIGFPNPAWADYLEPIEAVGSETELTIPLDGTSQQYFQVLRLEP